MDWHARFIKVAFAKANRPTQEKFRLIATAQFAFVTELLKGPVGPLSAYAEGTRS
jgi:hypothetical protein